VKNETIAKIFPKLFCYDCNTGTVELHSSGKKKTDRGQKIQIFFEKCRGTSRQLSKRR
jgi:hypothetical protein